MNFLSNDSMLGKILGSFFHIVCINLLFLLGCIPIITIGASLSGMYYACMKMIRGTDTSGWKDFLKGFRDNLKQGTISWLLFLLIGFILLTNYNMFKNPQSLSDNILFLITMVSLAAVAIIAMYLFPVIAAFRNNLKSLIKYSAFFAGKNILILIRIAFMNIFPLIFTYANLDLIPLFAFIWFFVGFAAVAYHNSTLFLRLFTPFLLQTSPDEIEE
ncbi:MAG: DUF624 domain-containing protein [Oliverpabstia sp.]